MEKQLLSMSDFVMNIHSRMHTMKADSPSVRQFYNEVHEYAKLLKTPLVLGMFVPCDEDGHRLGVPANYGANEQLDNTAAQIKYQQAQERVIFEGRNEIGVKLFELWIADKMTIEGLVKRDVTLTEAKAKELGLC